MRDKTGNEYTEDPSNGIQINRGRNLSFSIVPPWLHLDSDVWTSSVVLGDGNELYGWLPFFTIYSLKRGGCVSFQVKANFGEASTFVKRYIGLWMQWHGSFLPLPKPMSVKVYCKYPRGNGYSHCKHQAVERVMYPDQSIHAATLFVFIHFQEE